MPKLTEATRTRRRLRLEEAAIGLFLERGFHGVGLREICEAAGVSSGNFYNHFRSKREVFASALARLYAEFQGPDEPLARFFAEPGLRGDFDALGLAIQKMVKRHRRYLLLVLVDVVEFEGQHVRRHYEGLVDKIRAATGGRLATAKRAGAKDPAFVLAAAYMQFFNYFMVEDLFGARGHMGAPPAAVVKKLAAIYR